MDKTTGLIGLSTVYCGWSLGKDRPFKTRRFLIPGVKLENVILTCDPFLKEFEQQIWEIPESKYLSDTFTCYIYDIYSIGITKKRLVFYIHKVWVGV